MRPGTPRSYLPSLPEVLLPGPPVAACLAVTFRRDLGLSLPQNRIRLRDSESSLFPQILTGCPPVQGWMGRYPGRTEAEVVMLVEGRGRKAVRWGEHKCRERCDKMQTWNLWKLASTSRAVSGLTPRFVPVCSSFAGFSTLFSKFAFGVTWLYVSALPLTLVGSCVIYPLNLDFLAYELGGMAPSSPSGVL